MQHTSTTARYLDRFMATSSSVPLMSLFARAHAPAKEITESWAALHHLRPFLRTAEPVRVLHIGDGAHARTGALFAFMTHAENISIDPATNPSVIGHWCHRWRVQRFDWIGKRVEDTYDKLNALPPMKTLITFVHAHVDTDAVLGSLRWDGAFTLACCLPRQQLSCRYQVAQSGEDHDCLSHQRSYQVLLNQKRDDYDL